VKKTRDDTPAGTGAELWTRFKEVGGGSVDAFQDDQGTMKWLDLETISLSIVAK
jgi:hypothetical protein